MAKSVTKGDTYELRLGRVLFAEGAFVRRAINLNLHFGEEFTVTDLDVLALRFSPSLDIHTTIGESKTAEGKNSPKTADRLLWLHGVRTLVNADSAFVATVRRANDRLRGLSRELGITLLDERDLAHRERILGLDEHAPWGPNAPELLRRQREIYDTIKANSDLKRVYWFLRSEFWLVPPLAGLKRTFGAGRLLASQWTARDNNPEHDALLWLGRQAQVNAVVALVRLAGASYRHDPAAVRGRLLEGLASGPEIDYAALTELSRQADRYIMAILRDAGVDPGRHVEALGALSPSPPSYAEPLLEVIERLGAEPAVAALLPRLADWRVAEVESGQMLSPFPAASAPLDDGDRLLRLIGTFLNGQIKLPAAMLAGVLVNEQVDAPAIESPAAVGAAGNGTESSATPLFDSSSGENEPAHSR